MSNKIDLANFIVDFKNEFMDSEEVEFAKNTIFRDLDEWDSLTGMAIQVMIEDKYSVRVPDDKFKSFKTIEDIYLYVEEQI